MDQKVKTGIEAVPQMYQRRTSIFHKNTTRKTSQTHFEKTRANPNYMHPQNHHEENQKWQQEKAHGGVTKR